MPDSMLACVLGAYLDGISEREFDLPLAALLGASGFRDVHFTHGNVEFGKDFIAKRDEGGITVQYSFQSKAGDISHHAWRNEVMGQMLESLLSGLSHPNFDKGAPHQAVLVTTGKLLGNAALGLQEMNCSIEETCRRRPFVLWDRGTLVELLETHGLGGVYQATAAGYLGYGKFYQLYGRSLEGRASPREFEEHSRRWLNGSVSPDKRVLCSALESEILADQCRSKGLSYEAVFSHLTFIRTTIHRIASADSKDELQRLGEVYSRALDGLRKEARQYFADFNTIWDGCGRNLSSVAPGPNGIISYSIQCTRLMEVAGCLYFLEDNESERDRIASLLLVFISQEPGCAHIPGDYYAVSLVLPVLALCRSGHRELAAQLLREAAVWLCDRYQDGFGLADISASPYGEICTLFGYPFEFIRVRPRKASFAATVLADLAAFVADAKLYADIVNDFKAVQIMPQYWQVPDTLSLFALDGEDIVAYPNIAYSDSYVPFDSFDFADHIRHEPRDFATAKSIGSFGLFMMMLLLRDRYFPSLWRQLAADSCHCI